MWVWLCVEVWLGVSVVVCEGVVVCVVVCGGVVVCVCRLLLVMIRPVELVLLSLYFCESVFSLCHIFDGSV